MSYCNVNTQQRCRCQRLSSVSLFTPNFPFFLSNPSFPTLHSHFHSHSQPLSFENVDDAVSQFNRMLCLIHTTPIVESNKILDSFAKMMQYPTAVSLSHRLELKGIVPSLVTLNILINCFCHMGQITFGFSVFRPKILKRNQPDTITLNTLIKGFCLKGHIKKALTRTLVMVF